MATYIQSFENNRWCVNNEPREIQAGEVVAFELAYEAEHFTTLGRAGLIGEFGSDEEAMRHLEVIIAQAAKQQEEEEARAAAAEAAAVASNPDPQASNEANVVAMTKKKKATKS